MGYLFTNIAGMTLLPNSQITGILAAIVGLLILVWSIVFIQRKRSGSISMLLSVALLLFSGAAGVGLLIHCYWRGPHWLSGVSRICFERS